MICPECRGKGTATYGVTVCGNETSMLMRRFEDICHTCHGSGRKPQTNADRYRAMSDEELAGELIVYRDYWDDYETHVGCFDTWEDALKAEVDYLKQPVKGVSVE